MRWRRRGNVFLLLLSSREGCRRNEQGCGSHLPEIGRLDTRLLAPRHCFGVPVDAAEFALVGGNNQGTMICISDLILTLYTLPPQTETSLSMRFRAYAYIASPLMRRGCGRIRPPTTLLRDVGPSLGDSACARSQSRRRCPGPHAAMAVDDHLVAPTVGGGCTRDAADLACRPDSEVMTLPQARSPASSLPTKPTQPPNPNPIGAALPALAIAHGASLGEPCERHRGLHASKAPSFRG